jgi:hypothetical protein
MLRTLSVAFRVPAMIPVSRDTAPLPLPIDLRVLRIAKGQTVRVRCLASPAARQREPLLGYLTHWIRGRTRVCRGEPGCEPAIHKVDPIWYGFLPFDVWDDNAELWFPVVLQVTESLDLDFRGRLERGQFWLISRPNVKTSGNPVRGQFLGHADLETLPEPFGFQATLAILFHWPELPLPKTPNPTPARVSLSPSVGAPPPGSKAAVQAQEKANMPKAEEAKELFRKLRERGGKELPSGNGQH